MILCLNATHMVSSHVDQYVVEPFARRGAWRWKYAFLQHGVTTGDISRWLNTKAIDLLVTASRHERASIAGDGSSYKFTTKEVVRTGFPRHDRLLQLAEDSSKARTRNHILVMPTWRAYFSGESKQGTGERGVNPEFYDTRFAQEWKAFLESPDLQDMCDREGLDSVCPFTWLSPFVQLRIAEPAGQRSSGREARLQRSNRRSPNVHRPVAALLPRLTRTPPALRMPLPL